jgi:hypothetical protein
MTTVSGLIPFFGRQAYNKHTCLIIDVCLGHTFTTANHVCKLKTASPLWNLKNGGNTPLDIVTKAFAPMVAN